MRRRKKGQREQKVRGGISTFDAENKFMYDNPLKLRQNKQWIRTHRKVSFCYSVFINHLTHWRKTSLFFCIPPSTRKFNVIPYPSLMSICWWDSGNGFIYCQLSIPAFMFQIMILPFKLGSLDLKTCEPSQK